MTLAAVSNTTAQTRTFMLPDLGEGLTEAEVVEWHVAAGDDVRVDQIVVTVETAKASVDLPCPYAGCVQTLHAAPGAVLEVGRPLLSVGIEPQTGTATKSGPADLARAAGEATTDPKSGPEARSGSGNVLVGYGTSDTQRSGRRRVTPALPAVAGQPAAAPKVISPVVRKLARDNGIDCAGLTPTGRGDVIRRADVEAALQVESQGGLPPGHAIPGSGQATPARGPVRTDRASDIRIPLHGVRKAIADKMTISRREIPEASVWVDVDATGLLAAKEEIKAVNAGAGISLLALFARIATAGLQKFPELNAQVDLEAQEIIQIHDINLSFAAQSPRGLVVPVVHGAGKMSTAELAAALRELSGLARDGKLTPAQMMGGTFTLNNYGVFGTDGATPIINYPEAAMLGVGRIIDRPWAHEGQVALRKVAQLGLTFDHRVCDGGTAGGFLRFVADCVEKPALLLAHL